MTRKRKTAPPPDLDDPQRRPDPETDPGNPLWEAVKKSVIPIDGRQAVTLPKTRMPRDTAPGSNRRRRMTDTTPFMGGEAYADSVADPPLRAPRLTRMHQVPEQGIDARVRRDLTRGKRSVDGVIDLHGLTQPEAYGALERRIIQGVTAGNRCLLVVTGRGVKRYAQTPERGEERAGGRRGGGREDRAGDKAPDLPVEFRRARDFGEDKGVLRRVVPDWLRGPVLAPYVVSFEAAHQRDGGKGALYVMLRRRERL